MTHKSRLSATSKPYNITVFNKDKTKSYPVKMIDVKCTCGNTKTLKYSDFISKTKSCGCLHKEILSKRNIANSLQLDVNRIFDLYTKENMSCEKIAEILECSRWVIVKCLKQNNKFNSSINCSKTRNGKWLGTTEISQTYFSRIKKGAISRGLEFNLTIEDVHNQFLKQNKKCALSNLDLVIVYVKDKKSFGNASLDRIDSQKGYTTDNIQWIHKDINRMKNDFNEEYFIQMCTLIHNHKSLNSGV